MSEWMDQEHIAELQAEIKRLRAGLKNMSANALDNMEGADTEGFEAWESVHVACEKLLDHVPGVGKKEAE